MTYLVLSIIFGVISAIMFIFPMVTVEKAPIEMEISANKNTAPTTSATTAPRASGQPATVQPSVAPHDFNADLISPTSLSVATIVPSPAGLPVVYTSSRLRFSVLYNQGSETILECPTFGETVDITRYQVAGVSSGINCNQLTGMGDISVERKTDINGEVIVPTYVSKKEQLIQQNPGMTVEYEADIVVSGVSGKRWKTSAFDLIFMEFDGVLYILSVKMIDPERQFTFT